MTKLKPANILDSEVLVVQSYPEEATFTRAGGSLDLRKGFSWERLRLHLGLQGNSAHLPIEASAHVDRP